MALTDSYDAIYERALQLVSESHWDEALAEYRRMFLRLSRLSPATLDSHPDLKELLSHAAFDMTQLLAELERYDEAMDILRRLVDILPEHKSLWLREAARFRIQLGEAEQALAELQVLAQQEPGQPYTKSAWAKPTWNWTTATQPWRILNGPSSWPPIRKQERPATTG